MPLSGFQEEVLRLLAAHRTPDSYLAGGAALHRASDSLRFSQDLGFFHDSEQRTAEAFAADRGLLEGSGFTVEIRYGLPGNVRALVLRGEDRTRPSPRCCRLHGALDSGSPHQTVPASCAGIPSGPNHPVHAHHRNIPGRNAGNGHDPVAPHPADQLFRRKVNGSQYPPFGGEMQPAALGHVP